ncbi:hypothetical protein ACNKHM_03415 [Shigella sonnei]
MNRGYSSLSAHGAGGRRYARLEARNAAMRLVEAATGRPDLIMLISACPTVMGLRLSATCASGARCR